MIRRWFRLYWFDLLLLGVVCFLLFVAFPGAVQNHRELVRDRATLAPFERR